MNVLLPEQQFSEKTLKGFLLKNVDIGSKDSTIYLLNEFLIKRVDEFWDSVVIPLKALSKFNGNKINWYFEIYKEGLEARKVAKNPFLFVGITTDKIQSMVVFFKEKSPLEYIDLGTSFLSNCFSLLTSWYRDQLILKRLKTIYSSNSPHEWILTAEKEEHGIMSEQVTSIPEVAAILNTIKLILSKRI